MVIGSGTTALRMRARPRCPVCGSDGTLLYNHWEDRVLDIPGYWTWKQCSVLNCRTLWQDPVTVDDDLHKLYINYPTHLHREVTQHDAGVLQRIRNLVRNSYLHIAYGYPPPHPAWLSIFLYPLACSHIAWKDTQAAGVFYLPFKKDGVLLDIGCGNGSSMLSLKERGWTVKGIDFDEKAVSFAQAKGLSASTGDLFSQQFKDNSFDAILLNHVIEHLPSPLAILKECRRILKKDGVLVAITPNGESRGHQKYTRHWRGFEPDHLQIYTLGSLELLAREAGFALRETFSSLQGVNYLLDSSRNLMFHGKPEIPVTYTFSLRVKRQMRWFLLGLLHQFVPGKDEVAVLRCRK